MTLFQESDAGVAVEADYTPLITLILDAIDAAEQINELDLPGFRLHRLKGDKRNLLSVRGVGRLAHHIRI